MAQFQLKSSTINHLKRYEIYEVLSVTLSIIFYQNNIEHKKR